MTPDPFMRAPFPWFGGKSRVSDVVWRAFGDTRNYVEPFFGSGAVLLGRPRPDGVETVNDLDGFICNFWRAIAQNPASVAEAADNPVNENDLHARHAWLVGQRETLRAQLDGDPAFCDVRIAGWWVWGLCCWIGSGWCAGTGPWQVVDGLLVDTRQLPHLGDNGRGVNRQLPHLGNNGQGVLQQGRRDGLRAWFSALSDRLRNVRVCSGDWTRVTGDSVTWNHPATRGASATCAVFLDPPYEQEGDVYQHGHASVAADVRAWALEAGKRPNMRIALCGYEGEHAMPGWTVHAWKAKGGYGGQSQEHDNPNARRERIWFSPACLPLVARQASLFGAP